jgi:beta-N-acetylhexosaminidase
MHPASSSVLEAGPLAVVLGCEGPRLTAAEAALFRAADPLGFILFRRNVESPAQVRALVGALRAAVGRPDAPVLVDQEGGRVQRLRGPDWPPLPPARAIGDLAARDPEAGKAAAFLLGRILAAELRPLGIDVNCVPVADVTDAGTTDAIGDRAFGDDPERVAVLAGALAAGTLAGGLLPVVKHLPGHGRAVVDSHHETPHVDASRADLEARDFVPFRALQALPCAMVAHVVFHDVDPRRPASISPAVIGTLIRREFGFDGFLFSDDIDMEALAGSPADRARAVLAAGCDAALHCNGRLAEMEAIAATAPRLTLAARRRWALAAAYPDPAPDPFDPVAGRRRLADLLSTEPV